MQNQEHIPAALCTAALYPIIILLAYYVTLRILGKIMLMRQIAPRIVLVTKATISTTGHKKRARLMSVLENIVDVSQDESSDLVLTPRITGTETVKDFY